MELSRRSCCVQASLHDNLSRSPPRQLPSPGPLTAYALHSTSESLYQHRSSTSPLHPGHGSQGGAPFRWPEPTGPITAYATVSAEQPPPPLKRYPVIGPPRTYTRLPNISVPSYPPPVSGPTSLSFVQRHTVYYAALASTSNSSSLNCAHPWFPATPSNTYASIRPRQPITVSPVSYLAIPACAATQAAPSPPSPHFQAKNADSFPRPALPLRNHKLELQENNVESIKSSIKLKQLPRQTSTTTMAKSSSQIFYQQPPLLFKTSQNIGTFNVTDTFEPPRPQTRFPRMQLSEMDTNLNRPVNPLSPITQKFRRHVFLTETSISDFVIKRSISELDESGSNLSSETCSAVRDNSICILSDNERDDSETFLEISESQIDPSYRRSGHQFATTTMADLADDDSDTDIDCRTSSIMDMTTDEPLSTEVPISTHSRPNLVCIRRFKSFPAVSAPRVNARMTNSEPVLIRASSDSEEIENSCRWSSDKETSIAESRLSRRLSAGAQCSRRRRRRTLRRPPFAFRLFHRLAYPTRSPGTHQTKTFPRPAFKAGYSSQCTETPMQRSVRPFVRHRQVFTDFTNTMGSAGKEEIYWETTGPIPVPQRKQKVRQRRKNFGSKIDLNGIQLFKWSDTRRDLEVGTPDPPSTVSENTGVESTLPLSSRMTRMRHSSNPGKDIPALRMQEDSTAVKLLKLLVDSHSQINRTGMTSEIVKHRSHQTRHRGGEKLSYDDYAESLRRYRNRLRKQAVSVFDASGSTSTSTGTGQTWTYKPRSLPTVKRRQNLDIV